MTWQLIKHRYRFQQGLIGGFRRYLWPSALGGLSEAQYNYASQVYNAQSFIEIIAIYKDFQAVLDDESYSDCIRQAAEQLDKKEWVTVLPKILNHYPLLTTLKVTETITSALNQSTFSTPLNQFCRDITSAQLTKRHLPFFIKLKKQLSLFTRNKLAFLFRTKDVALELDNELYSLADEQLFFSTPLSTRKQAYFNANQVLTPEVLFSINEDNADSIKSILAKITDSKARNSLLYSTLLFSHQKGQLTPTIERFKRLNLPFKFDSDSLCLLMVEQAESIKARSESDYTDKPWQQLFQTLEQENFISGVFAKLVANSYKTAADRENLARAFGLKLFSSEYLTALIETVEKSEKEPLVRDDFKTIRELLASSDQKKLDKQLRLILTEWQIFFGSLEALYKVDDFYALKIAIHKTILNNVKRLIMVHLNKLTAFEKDVLAFKKQINELFSGDYSLYGRRYASEHIAFILRTPLKSCHETQYQTELAIIRQYINALIPICQLYENEPGIKAYKTRQERLRRDAEAVTIRKEVKRQRLGEMLKEAKTGELGFTSYDEIERLCTNEGVLDEKLYHQQCLVFKTMNALI